MNDTAAVVGALSGKRYRYRDEVSLHAALSSALDEAGIPHDREVRLTGGRIDFMVHSLGVEVKVKGSISSLRAQIERYSADDRVSEFLIVTTRPTHRSVTGVTANGKRVRVLTIGGLSL